MLAQSSAMGNPYEFRETMKAAFGYIDKTVEEVLAEQEHRRKQAEGKGSRKGSKTAPTTNATPQRSEIDKLNALLAAAKPGPASASE